MTRVYTTGFETANTLGWISAPTLSTSVKHTGTYGAYNGTRSIAAATEYYARVWFYSDMSQDRVIIGFQSVDYGGSLVRAIIENSNAKINYQVASASVGYGAITLAANTWYMLEVHVVIDNSSGTIEARIDGVSDFSYSGDTLPGTTPYNIDKILLGDAGPGPMYVDDVAINSTSGGADNSWPGDGRVIAIMPNANGDKSDMVGSDSDSTDNYLLVDEIPNDGDTTYVQTDTIGNYDLYNLGACGLSNVDILRVWVEAVAKETEVAGGKVALGIKPSGGTESWGTDKDLLTSYARFAGTEHTVNPATSAAWTTGEVDSLQAGVKATA